MLLRVRFVRIELEGQAERHGLSLATVLALRATAHPSAMKPRMDGAPGPRLLGGVPVVRER